MKSPSDSTLQQWWRKAVIAVHGDRCVLCGAQPVECHHIVKRRHAILRHDWRNGVPLCASCHASADTMFQRAEIAKHVSVEYIASFERVLLKDYLRDDGITRAEFLRDELEELKAVVQNPALYRKWLED